MSKTPKALKISAAAICVLAIIALIPCNVFARPVVGIGSIPLLSLSTSRRDEVRKEGVIIGPLSLERLRRLVDAYDFSISVKENIKEELAGTATAEEIEQAIEKRSRFEMENFLLGDAIAMLDSWNLFGVPYPPFGTRSQARAYLYNKIESILNLVYGDLFSYGTRGDGEKVLLMGELFDVDISTNQQILDALVDSLTEMSDNLTNYIIFKNPDYVIPTSPPEIENLLPDNSRALIDNLALARGHSLREILSLKDIRWIPRGVFFVGADPLQPWMEHDGEQGALRYLYQNDNAIVLDVALLQSILENGVQNAKLGDARGIRVRLPLHRGGGPTYGGDYRELENLAYVSYRRGNDVTITHGLKIVFKDHGVVLFASPVGFIRMHREFWEEWLVPVLMAIGSAVLAAFTFGTSALMKLVIFGACMGLSATAALIGGPQGMMIAALAITAVTGVGAIAKAAVAGVKVGGLSATAKAAGAAAKVAGRGAVKKMVKILTDAGIKVPQRIIDEGYLAVRAFAAKYFKNAVGATAKITAREVLKAMATAKFVGAFAAATFMITFQYKVYDSIEYINRALGLTYPHEVQAILKDYYENVYYQKSSEYYKDVLPYVWACDADAGNYEGTTYRGWEVNAKGGIPAAIANFITDNIVGYYNDLSKRPGHYFIGSQSPFMLPPMAITLQQKDQESVEGQMMDLFDEHRRVIAGAVAAAVKSAVRNTTADMFLLFKDNFTEAISVGIAYNNIVRKTIVDDISTLEELKDDAIDNRSYTIALYNRWNKAGFGNKTESEFPGYENIYQCDTSIDAVYNMFTSRYSEQNLRSAYANFYDSFINDAKKLLAEGQNISTPPYDRTYEGVFNKYNDAITISENIKANVHASVDNWLQEIINYTIANAEISATASRLKHAMDNGLGIVTQAKFDEYSDLVNYFGYAPGTGITITARTANEPTGIPDNDLRLAESLLLIENDLVEKYVLSGRENTTENLSYARLLADYVKDNASTSPPISGSDPEDVIWDVIEENVVKYLKPIINNLIDAAYTSVNTMNERLEEIFSTENARIYNYIGVENGTHPWSFENDLNYIYWDNAKAFVDAAQTDYDKYVTALSENKIGYAFENIISAVSKLKMADIFSTRPQELITWLRGEANVRFENVRRMFELVEKLIDNDGPTTENVINTYIGTTSMASLRSLMSTVSEQIRNAENKIAIGTAPNMVSALRIMIGENGSLSRPDDGTVIRILSDIESALKNALTGYGDYLTSLYSYVKGRYDELLPILDEPSTIDILATENKDINVLISTYLTPVESILTKISTDWGPSDSWAWGDISRIQAIGQPLWKSLSIQDNLESAKAKIDNLRNELSAVFWKEIVVNLIEVDTPEIVVVNSNNSITYTYRVSNPSSMSFEKPAISISLPDLPQEDITRVEYRVLGGAWTRIPADNLTYTENDVVVRIQKLDRGENVDIRIKYNTVLVFAPTSITFHRAPGDAVVGFKNMLTAKASVTAVNEKVAKELDSTIFVWKFGTSNPSTPVFADNRRFGELSISVDGLADSQSEIVSLTREYTDTTVTKIVARFPWWTYDENISMNIDIIYITDKVTVTYGDPTVLESTDNNQLLHVSIPITITNYSMVPLDNVVLEEPVPLSAVNVDLTGTTAETITENYSVKFVKVRFNMSAASVATPAVSSFILEYDIPYSQLAYVDLRSLVHAVREVKIRALGDLAGLPSLKEKFDNVAGNISSANALKIAGMVGGEVRVYDIIKENFRLACNKLLESLKILKNIDTENESYFAERYIVMREKIDYLIKVTENDIAAINAVGLAKLIEPRNELREAINVFTQVSEARNLAEQGNYKEAVEKLVPVYISMKTDLAKAMDILSSAWSSIVREMENDESDIEKRFNNLKSLPSKIDNVSIPPTSPTLIDMTAITDNISYVKTLKLGAGIKFAMESLDSARDLIASTRDTLVSEEYTKGALVKAGASEAISWFNIKIRDLRSLIDKVLESYIITITDHEVISLAGTVTPPVAIEKVRMDNSILDNIKTAVADLVGLDIATLSDELAIEEYLNNKSKFELHDALTGLEDAVNSKKAQWKDRLDTAIDAAAINVRELTDNKIKLLGEGWINRAREELYAEKYMNALIYATAAQRLTDEYVSPPGPPVEIPWTIIIVIVIIAMLGTCTAVILKKRSKILKAVEKITAPQTPKG